MTRTIVIAVDGHPKTFASGEDEWRKAIACAAALHASEATWLRDADDVSVELNFRIEERRRQGMDIDNLAKPVLDTLFDGKPTQRALSRFPTGQLIDKDDGCVSQLIVNRLRVQSANEEGVVIIIQDRLRKSVEQSAPDNT